MRELVKLLMALAQYYTKTQPDYTDFFLKKLKCYMKKYEDCLIKDIDSGQLSGVVEQDIHCDVVETFEAFCGLSGNYEIIAKLLDEFDMEKVLEHFDDEKTYERHRLERFSYKNLHRYICKNIFDDIEKTRGVNSENYFYVHVDDNDILVDSNGNADINSAEGYVKLDIFSKAEWEYDETILHMLRSQNEELAGIIRELYAPYFTEYYIRSDQLTKEQVNFIFRFDEEYPKSYVWHKARFVSDENEQPDGDGYIFEGVYSYSGSPIKYRNTKLWIEDENVDRAKINAINKTYLPVGGACADEDIKETLTGIFAKVKFKKVLLYKVGNGNCIYSYGTSAHEEKRLLYDVGFDSKKAIKAEIEEMPSPYQLALKRIAHILPSCVILSHWDTDHYKACVYCRKEIYDCIWIAPDYYDAGVNAKRLGAYLSAINKLLMVDRALPRMLHIPLNYFNDLTLYIGKKSAYISKQNCEGIAIKIENRKEIRCLMQGDVPYSSLPDEAKFKNDYPYDYLVVPHHGSKMKYDLLKNEGRAVASGKAVICCDVNFAKGRPDKEHYKYLKSCYNEIEMTGNAKTYMEFDLTKKGQLIKN